MLHPPFYDPKKSYEENYDQGPFGAFADGETHQATGKPEHSYFGQPVYLPFGIPAGPLLNSRFVMAAFRKGFDICVYKTVRSSFYPCHPLPNVLGVEIKGDLTPEKMSSPVVAGDTYREPLSITNSFGVPSKDPEVWQEDVEHAVAAARTGQVLVLSFMGTVRADQTQEEFIEDYLLAGRLAGETSAKVFEVNLSCPNIGNEGLVCYNLEVTKKICQRLRPILDNKPLILKIGYFESDEELLKLAEIANEYADGIGAINTLQAAVVDKKGQPALPGKTRLRSGICGASIKWAGLEMVERLQQIKEQKGFSFKIDGIGGVSSADDFKEYRAAGADAVLSATAAMWNPQLAAEIKKSLRGHQ